MARFRPLRENVGDQGIDVRAGRERDAKHRLGEGTEEVRESPRECSHITRGPILFDERRLYLIGL